MGLSPTTATGFNVCAELRLRAMRVLGLRGYVDLQQTIGVTATMPGQLSTVYRPNAYLSVMVNGKFQHYARKPSSRHDVEADLGSLAERAHPRRLDYGTIDFFLKGEGFPAPGLLFLVLVSDANDEETQPDHLPMLDIVVEISIGGTYEESVRVDAPIARDQPIYSERSQGPLRPGTWERPWV